MAAASDPAGTKSRRSHRQFPGRRFPGYLIRRLQQVSMALFVEEAAARGADLTPVQYAALIGIAAYPGIDQASLAGLIACDRATIGGVLDRLEVKRLISRSASSRDRRMRVMSIAGTGRALVKRLAPAIARTQERILAPLSAEERTIFVLLLTKLVGANENVAAPRSPGTARRHGRGVRNAD
jgi:MarR family transcriptional regulator, temperature-dependent positive regulator of motility